MAFQYQAYNEIDWMAIFFLNENSRRIASHYPSLQISSENFMRGNISQNVSGINCCFFKCSFVGPLSCKRLPIEF